MYRGDKSLYLNKIRHFLKEEIFNKRITLSTVFLNDVFKVNFSTTKEDFLFYHYSFDKLFPQGYFWKFIFFFFFLLYLLLFIRCFPCRPKRTNDSFQANIKYSKIQTIPKLFHINSLHWQVIVYKGCRNK